MFSRWEISHFPIIPKRKQVIPHTFTIVLVLSIVQMNKESVQINLLKTGNVHEDDKRDEADNKRMIIDEVIEQWQPVRAKGTQEPMKLMILRNVRTT